MPIKANSVVVFGGSGFIGTELVRQLVADGVEGIVSADLLPPRRRFENVEYEVADVREPIGLACEPEIVFNLAAVHRTPGHPDGEYYDTNVNGALRVVEFCEKVDVRTIVFTSSISVYGPADDLVTEASPLHPNSAYGKSKVMAEHIHRQWQMRGEGRRLVIVRPAVVFGHGEGGNFERLHRAIRSQYFVFPGRRDSIKACGYVAELIRCLDWALEQPDDHLLFNFAYPERYTIEDIARSIAKHGGLKEPRITVPPSAVRLLQRVGGGNAKTLARIRKLTGSTNVFPGVLVQRSYEYSTDLDSGVASWLSIAKASETLSHPSEDSSGPGESVKSSVSPLNWPMLSFANKVAGFRSGGKAEPLPASRGEASRIVIHDYCGHPFQVQLSRSLARRGHTVLHLYCSSVSSPRGALEPQGDDPSGLTIEAISLGTDFEKYRPIDRLRQERKYGRLVASRIAKFEPNVVISGNTPLLSQRAIQRQCYNSGAYFVFWLQDLIGVGVRSVMARRGSRLGTAGGEGLARLEKRMLRSSHAVVAISEDFRGLLVDCYGLNGTSVSVIENWAGLDEIPVRLHANDWAERHGLLDCRVVLYAGTLGMKHRPELLVELASSLLGRPEMRVVVASEGLGADWLLAQKVALGLDNLVVLGFQPYADLPDMLGTADILTVVLESDAGVFSVPSKVLTYLCAGRPLLAALPSENLAARIISRCGAGVLVTSNDTAAFVKEAEALIEDDDLRHEMGRRARNYAEDTFDIERITDRFEAVFNGQHDSRDSSSTGPTVAAGRENQ